MLQKIIETIKPYLDDVNVYINQILDTDISLLNSVEKHIFNSDGKRIRPVLHILSGLVCGQIKHDNIIVASTTEFIHTATLLHDDVIDDSPTRRGKPTVNNLWGNELSVMVGDYFYTQSMNSLLEVSNIEILRLFSDATQRMTEGEIIQHDNLGNIDLRYDEYIDIIRRKTAILFSVCCGSAAVLADFTPEKIKQWIDYGLNLGLAFQLIDDLLDYRGQQKQTGKSVFCDLREKKVTYPLLYVLRSATSTERRMVNDILIKEEKTDDDIEKVVELIEAKNGFQETLTLAEEYCKKALDSLKDFSSQPHFALLETLTHYTTLRSK